MNKPKKSANQQNFLISNIFYFLWDINKSNRLQSGCLYSVKQDLYKTLMQKFPLGSFQADHFYKNERTTAKMNDTQKLLEFIYKNAEMGRKTVDPIKNMNNDSKFQTTLDRMLSDYNEICTEADRLLKECGVSEASGLNIGEKMMTEMSLRFNTIKDRSVPHLADMLLKGASMGVTDISKKLDECRDADEGSVRLANRLLKMNSDTIDEMKQFLTVTAEV